MTKERLTPDQKNFVVQRLAVFDTPTMIIESFKEDFGVTLSPQQVHSYNPEKIAGKHLSPGLKDLFWATRKQFQEESAVIPIAQKSYRLRRLHQMVETAIRKGNHVLASSLLEQAAKEVGEAYTNHKTVSVSSPDGTMSPQAPVDKTLIDALVDKLTN